MKVIEIENDSKFEELMSENIVSEDSLIIFVFSATWCGPCKKLKKFIKEEGGLDEYEGKIVVFVIDVDGCDDLANGYSIRSMPTVVIHKMEKDEEGDMELKIIKKIVGFDKQGLIETISNNVV